MVLGIFRPSQNQETTEVHHVVHKGRGVNQQRVRNAISNFLKLGDPKHIFQNQDALRAGSLGFLAHEASWKDILKAIEQLNDAGLLKGKTKEQVVSELTTLFESKPVRDAYATKTTNELSGMAGKLREVGKALAKTPARTAA